jgi:hypothetical protein
MVMIGVLASLAFGSRIECLCGILHCSTPNSCQEKARAAMRHPEPIEYLVSR